MSVDSEEPDDVSLAIGELHELALYRFAESVAVLDAEVDPFADEIPGAWNDAELESNLHEYARDVRAGFAALENHRHLRSVRFDHSFYHEGSLGGGGGGGTLDAREHVETEEELSEPSYWRWRRRPGNEAIARDFERLFHVVLPNHATLDMLEFLDCPAASPRIVPIFLSGMTTTKRWSGLHFRNSWMCEAACHALAEVLARGVRIQRLTLEFCHLSQRLCQVICDAAADNSHVRALTVVDEHAGPFHNGALRKLLHSPTSGLQELEIGAGDWEWEIDHRSPDGRFQLFRARSAERRGDDDDELTGLLTLLRTNVGVQALTLRYEIPPGRLAIVMDLVRTYNFSLHRLVLTHAPVHEQLDINRILESNGHVRQDWARLQDPAAPHTALPTLLPEAMARIGRFPTLAFRFLRDPGNAAILSGLAEQGHRRDGHLAGRRGGKRPRTRPQRYEP
jgi:hypothetical protein